MRSWTWFVEVPALIISVGIWRCRRLLLFITVGVVMAQLAGCETPGAKPPATASVAESSENVWSRQRQCAGDSDNLANRLNSKWRQGDRGHQLVDWSNHYNAKEERCYVELRYYDASAARDRERALPFSFVELYDAVEQAHVASYTTDRVALSGFCQARKASRDPESVDCDEARQMVAEKMSR